MIVILALLFRRFLRPSLVDEARKQAERGLKGSMEGHAEMDMSVSGGSLLARIGSPAGFTAISQYFVMDWAAIWKDIVAGLLIAGALAAWVPNELWQRLFLTSNPTLAAFWGPLDRTVDLGHQLRLLDRQRALAAVLWNGGISFGGVLAFIFADLIILPILNIYRKYYGRRMTVFLGLTFYVAMAGAAYLVQGLFGVLGLIPTDRHALVVEASISLNYTSVLNVVFLALAAVLVWRFRRTGGAEMLAMMDMSSDEMSAMG